MRVAIAEFKQETNTFVPYPTTLDDFRAWHLWYGQEMFDNLRGTNSEVAGFLDVLDEAGVAAVPILGTFAMSGGRVTTSAFNALLDDLLKGIAVAGPLDGLLLALHGAMVTVGNDDPDGAILQAVRAAIGPDMPLIASMDLHANLTARCVEEADAIVGFKTSPHIDQRDTGQRAARIMKAMLQDGVRPAMAFVKIPMVAPASTHMHHVPGPFQRLMDASRACETGPILSATVFTVQPWLDIEEMGFATVAVAGGDATAATKAAGDLATMAWDERHAFMNIELVPIPKAIRRALARPDGPVVLSDCADGTGAGSPGDATAVITALLKADPQKPAYVCVRDAEAANTAIAAGLGAEITLDVGGKLDNVFNQPVRITGQVTFAGPVRFRFEGEGYTGVEMDMGPSVVIQAGNVHILIMSIPVMTVDPAMYRCVGLPPEEAQIVVVKSHIQFRAGYENIAREIILLDSPGMSSDHITTLPFHHVPRPMFPFDSDIEFICHPQLGRRETQVKEAHGGN